jgi:hypothetical protein
LSVSKVLDPPKSPLERGTLIPVPPFLRGVRGDLKVLKVTAKYFSNNLLEKLGILSFTNDLGLLDGITIN